MSRALRTVIYARVSPLELAAESLEEQRRRCQDYADAQGYPVLCAFYELGEGGRDAPQLETIRLMVSTGEIDLVLVATSERVSPSAEFRQWLREDLRYFGVRILAVGNAPSPALISSAPRRRENQNQPV
jgi:DNA invertase Pin-like site-specific DNA recombinase